MARGIVRSRSTGRRSARRPGTWARGTLGSATVGATTKVLLATFGLSNPGINETVRRTLGNVFVQSDQQAASETWRGALGFCIVSDAAAAAGAASIPGPVTEASDDIWFVWVPFAGSVLFSSAVGVFLGGFQFPFDSRAMRRAQEGQTIAVMVENPGTTGFSINVNLSLYSTLAT